MVLAFGSVAASAQTGRQSASISAAQQMIFFINDSFGHAWRVSAPLKREPFGYGVLERLGQSLHRSPYCAVNMMTSLTERSLPPEGMLMTSPRK